MSFLGIGAEGSKVTQEDLDAVRRKGQRPTTNAAQEMEITRLRQKGAESLNRLVPGTGIDRTAPNASRAMTMGSLAGLGEAARGNTEDLRMLDAATAGNAPSRAELLGRQNISQGLRAQVAGMGGVRGGGGAAAFRSGLGGLAATQSGTVGAATGARAAELGQARDAYTQAMGAARGAYGQGATALRGDDIRMATAQANIDARERAGARGQQQFFERLAADTRASDLDTRHLIEETEDDATRAKRRQDAMAREADWESTKNTVGGVAGVVTGVGKVVSDRRAKDPLPWGSLAGLRGGR